MNTDKCKLLYPSRIYRFSGRQLVYTDKVVITLVTMFWAQKRKLDAKYSARVCEMKSMTYEKYDL